MTGRQLEAKLAVITARNELAEALFDLVADSGECPFCYVDTQGGHDQNWGDEGRVCPLGRYIAARSAMSAPRASGPR